MRLAIDVMLDYSIAEPCDVLLLVEAAASVDQRLEVQDLRVYSPEPLRVVAGEEGIGQRTWARGEGRFQVEYKAVVAIDRAPVGPSALSAFLVASGSESAPDNRVGARSGRDISTDAATPACQSPESTRATARGRALGSSGVKTAWATAAASAVGSAPPTRVVFLVANCGNPSSWAALGWSPLRPIAGDLPRSLWLWPQAASASTRTMAEQTAAYGARRGTGRSVAAAAVWSRWCV